jgi:hypothetical protein
MSRFHCGQKLIRLNDCLLTFILPSPDQRDSVHAGANAEQEIRLASRIACRQRPTCVAIADIRSSKCKSVWMT